MEVSKEKAIFFKNKKHLPSQQIHEERKDGSLPVSFQVTQEREVEKLIKRWIPSVKVISPDSLKGRIRKELLVYLSLYAKLSSWTIPTSSA